MKQLINSKELLKRSGLLKKNKDIPEYDIPSDDSDTVITKGDMLTIANLLPNKLKSDNSETSPLPEWDLNNDLSLNFHSHENDDVSSQGSSGSSYSTSSSSSESMHTARSNPIDSYKKPIRSSKRRLIQNLLRRSLTGGDLSSTLISKKAAILKESSESTLTKTTSRTSSFKKDNSKHKKNGKNKKKRHKHDDGPISLAVLTEDGIQIKSRKPKSYEYEDYATILLSSGRTSMSSSRTSFTGTRNSDAESYMETASIVSCVTCLSDSVSSLSVDTSNTNRTSTLSTTSSNIGGSSGKNKHKHDYASVNGQIPTNSVIPYTMILNAKYVDIQSLNSDKKKIHPVIPNSNHHLVEITFGKPRRQDVVPKRLTLLIEYCNNNYSNDVVEEILQRSYKNSKRSRRILVIINPYGGKGNAKKIFMRKSKRLLMASEFKFDIQYTKYRGHGVDIAQNMDITKYDTIACASGDGIPHEVINGLYRRSDRVDAFNKLAITQIPCGSGNAMSVSCHWTNNPSYATLFLIKSTETRCDVMCMSQPSYKDNIPKLSFLSQTYGIIAESDINTEFIRWLGPARFELGVAFNIFQRKKYPCDLYVKYFAKSKNSLKLHYLDEISHQKKSPYDDLRDDEEGDEETVNEDIDNYITEDLFKVKYPLDQSVPDDWELVDPALTNNLGIFYTGKMPYVAADTKFFPAALPSDGVMDMVLTDSRTPFTRMIPILLALDKGSHVLQPEVIHSKIFAYRLVPHQEEDENVNNNHNNNGTNQDKDKDSVEDYLDYNDVEEDDDNVVKETGLLSIDGEKFPLETLQVEIIPKLCKFLLRDGQFVDTEFGIM